MKTARTRAIAVLFLVGLVLGAMTWAAQDQEKAPEPEKADPVKEKFSGMLVLWAAGPMTGRSTRMTMQVDRWTTNSLRYKVNIASTFQT